MQIRIETQQLHSALKTIAPVTQSKSLDILSNIRIDVTEDTFNISGFDLVNYIGVDIESYEVNSIVETHVLTDFPTLFRIIGRLKDNDELVLDFQSNLIKISTDSFNFQVPTLDCEEYPQVKEYSGHLNKENIVASNILFGDLLRASSHTAAPESSKAVISSVCVNENGEIQATDSHTLAIIYNDEIEVKQQLLISSEFIKALSKSIPSDELLTFYLSEQNGISLSYGNIVYYSRLVEGSYPKVGNLIPKDCTYSLEFNAKDLTEAITSNKLTTDDKVLGVVIDNQKMVLISSNHLGTCQSTVKVINDNVNSSVLELSLSIDYLERLLSTLGSDKVFIELSEKNRPVLLYNATTKAVIMPILKKVNYTG